ncbi:MAG: hypothetical protein IJR83_04900, partial [Clostridia bacterium]|nr:hypothetical protein [Clostridia bacterium]
MKILEIDIINFGKLSHYNLKPSEGLQVILEENGWGKTTLIHFIKAMFYGFSSYNNQSLVKNERKRFTPWNGGVCSGSLTFACDEGTYRIEKSFGARESLDRTVVKDVNTGLETDRFGKAPGVILFGLDADGFERSFCYTKKDVSDNSFDTISAKLNELEKTVYDLSSFGQAKKLLEGAKTELENKRGSGLLKNLQAEIDGLDAKIATLESSLYEQRNIEINIIHLDQQIAGKEKEKAAAASELEKAKEESARRQKLQQLLSSRDLLFEQESKLNTDLRSAGIALGPDKADTIREEIRRYEAASQQKSACDTAEKVVRLHELETVLADEDAVSKDLEKISELRKEIIRIDAKIESINLSEPVSGPEETRSAERYGRLIELCEERETAKKQFREKAAEDQKKKDRTGIITKSAAIAAFATAVLFLTVLKDAVPSFVAYVLFGVSILSFLLPVFLFRKGGTDDSSVLMPYE